LAENVVGAQPASLSLRDGLDLALKAGDKVDLGWRQYFTVVFALLAWASSNITKIEKTEATFLTIGIVLFSLTNCVALMKAYVLLRLISAEANEIVQRSTFLSANVQRYVEKGTDKFRFKRRIAITVFAHILAAAAISYLAWSEVPGFNLKALIH
jgi:hypothetical protein